MLLEIKGTVVFDAENCTKKHHSQSSWKRFAMISLDCDLCEYYAWFIKKRFNLVLNKPLRGAHVSFINDRMDFEVFEKGKEEFNGKEITFYIDIEPRTNGEHWWLRVYCEEAEDIREALGLSREPFFTFHITLGYAVGLRLEHSIYILQCSKFHEIIENRPRRPFKEHEIYKFRL